MNKENTNYIIKGGCEGSERLKIILNNTWNDSYNGLNEAGLCKGMRVLDIGCGNGLISRKISEITGKTGLVVGIDHDEKIIEIAKELNSDNPNPVQFVTADILSHSIEQEFDLIYARFILSHLPNPEKMVLRLKNLLKEGGKIVLEDIDSSGHYCFPPNVAFQKYVEFYEKAIQAKGANPYVGQELMTMIADLAFANKNMHVTNKGFHTGDGKHVALFTLENISDTLEKLNFCLKSEINQLILELRQFTENPVSIVSFPRIFCVWGTKISSN